MKFCVVQWPWLILDTLQQISFLAGQWISIINMAKDWSAKLPIEGSPQIRYKATLKILSSYLGNFFH